MSKCVVTGNETSSLTNSIPVSIEGRDVLGKVTDAHNEKVFEYYKEESNKANNGVELDEDTLRHFAPKINKRKVLDLIVRKERDIMVTLDEVLEA
jgi:hypothetical protein